MAQAINIGVTERANGEGWVNRCGIVRVDLSEDGIEFRAFTFDGELKRYATDRAAAKFLKSRGFAPNGMQL